MLPNKSSDAEAHVQVPSLKRGRGALSTDDSNPKRRRESVPAVANKLLLSASLIRQSRSYTSLKEQNTVSPVQLLRSICGHLSQKQMEQPKAHNFVKPSDKDLAAYDAVVVKAVRCGNLEALRSINKDDLNACNQFGESLLHMACRRGNTDVVRYMIEEADVDVTVCDDFGRTVLHDATWTATPNKDVMEILLKVVDPKMLLAEDVRGHTPFDYARKEHWPEWVEFLLRHQDVLNKQPARNEPTLACG